MDVDISNSGIVGEQSQPATALTLRIQKQIPWDTYFLRTKVSKRLTFFLLDISIHSKIFVLSKTFKTEYSAI